MKKKIREISSSDSFVQRLEQAKNKLEHELLNDDDLFVMACEKLMQTYTFEEKGYSRSDNA